MSFINITFRAFTLFTRVRSAGVELPHKATFQGEGGYMEGHMGPESWAVFSSLTGAGGS